jgi:ankyrin repeat protein
MGCAYAWGVRIYDEQTAFDAISKGDGDALTAALDAGTDPNAIQDCGWTLLMEAVLCGQLHVVDKLLSRGANVHLRTPCGNTALHLAVNGWRSDVFRRIFSEAGPRAMNLPDWYGWTPLHLLAYDGTADQMAFALSYPGIDISIRDCNGHTPFDLALRFRSRFRPVLQAYGVQEARWLPMRCTWIKLLIQL